MRGISLVLTVAAAFLAGALTTDPAAGQTVTSVNPPVVGQSIARAVGRINFAGTPNSGKTISDGLAFTIDGTTYGRGTWTYEFNLSGGLNIPGAIEVAPSSADVNVAGLKLAEVINTSSPSPPFWAVYYFSPPGQDYGISNGWFSIVWKYDNEYRLTAGGGIILTEAADPGADTSVSAFSNNNPETVAIFLGLRGAGLTGLNATTSVKLRHDVQTTLVYNGTITSQLGTTATVKFATLATGAGSPPVFPPLGDYDLEINGAIVLDKAVKLVENLLDDRSFDLHATGGAGIYCAHNSWDYTLLSPYWRRTKPFPAPDGFRKGWVWRQLAPRVYPFQTDDVVDSNNVGDNEYGSLQWSGSDGVHRMWQSVYVNFTQPTTLTLTGVLAAGADQREMTYGIQLRSGDENGTIIAETPPGQKLVDSFDWVDLALSGAFPAGTTQVTVVFYGDSPSTGAKALHVDTLLLRVDEDHATPPSITGMTTPAYAATGASATVTLTGSNLTAGQTSVRLEETVLSFGCGNWGDVGKFLNIPYEQYEKARGFANYQWRSGDILTLTGGSGVILGQYTIVRKVDEGTIEVAEDINGGTTVVDINDKTVTGYITHPAILATSVDASGSQVTATFDLTGAPAGSRNIVVQVGSNLPVIWRDGFNIAFAGPSLTNGSFELPDAASGCAANPRSETYTPASDWHVRHWNGFLDNKNVSPILNYRDDRWQAGGYDLPSCPAPELGLHYSSTSTYAYRGTAQYSETVSAEAGKTYTLSGFFGHSDLSKVRFTLLDGDSAAAPMAGASIEVLPAGSFQDWTFAHMTGTATGGMITAAWEVENTGAKDSFSPKVAWADHLVVEECTQPVTVTSVNPYAVANDTPGPVTLTITGSGFSGGTPEVMLVRAGQALVATSVTVLSDTSLTCQVTGLPTPGTQAFEVVVRNSGCIGSLAQGFVSAQTMILNEQFEEPLVALECGSTDPPAPRVSKTDPVSYWNFTDQLIREGTVFAPLECPLLSCDCPTPTTGCAGGHYASMSTGEGEVEQAWQTMKVTRGSKCTFGGWFSWDGTGTVNIKLLDGHGLNGTVLASLAVPHAAGGNDKWCYSFVEAHAASDLVTVVWELVDTVAGTPAAVHADFVTFAATICHDPFADVDNDGDVDQEDFAIFQLCATGPGSIPIPAEPSYCACFDVHGELGTPDGHIDTGDLILFEACASGPGIQAAVGCDNP